MADTPQAPASPRHGHRPSSGAARRAAARRADLDHGGIAVGMLAIMLLVGRADPPARTTARTGRGRAERRPRAGLPGRLRAMEAQALREAQAAAVDASASDDGIPRAAERRRQIRWWPTEAA